MFIYVHFSNSLKLHLKLYYQYIQFLFKSTTYILRLCDTLSMTLFLILGITTNMIFHLVHSSTMATLPGSKHGSKLIKNEKMRMEKLVPIGFTFLDQSSGSLMPGS